MEPASRGPPGEPAGFRLGERSLGGDSTQKGNCSPLNHALQSHPLSGVPASPCLPLPPPFYLETGEKSRIGVYITGEMQKNRVSETQPHRNIFLLNDKSTKTVFLGEKYAFLPLQKMKPWLLLDSV